MPSGDDAPQQEHASGERQASDQFLSISTMIRGRYRLLADPASPLLCAGMVHAGNAALREEALLSLRQNDALARFLIEMDHKLDAIIGLLQRDSLSAAFPGEGYIVRIGGSGLVFECRQLLDIGRYMELVLLLEEFPLRLLSVMVRVEACRTAGVLAGAPDGRAYDMSYTHMREEDRETVIRFIFSEQRRLIRQRKGE
jgi:hypothetical protein